MVALLITLVSVAAALVTLRDPVKNVLRVLFRRVGKMRLWLVNQVRVPRRLDELRTKLDEIIAMMQEQDKAQSQAEASLEVLEAAIEDLRRARALLEAEQNPSGSDGDHGKPATNTRRARS
jgi:predicted nuclease with TOPRIM domain